MTTFSNAAFNSLAYAAGRPTYPKSLFDYIFNYHSKSPSPRWIQAIDLGCGTGQATVQLTPFRRILGIDPSQSMLSQAQQHLKSLNLLSESPHLHHQSFTLKQGSAEDLSFIDAHSVDLVVAAQTCHWFDWPKAWSQISQILRPGATAAFWCYAEMRLTHYPNATPIINDFLQGSDPSNSLGPHFQRPGRTFLENHLTDIPPPPSSGSHAFNDFQRIHFTGPHLSTNDSLPVILRNPKMSYPTFLTYIKSSSAFHSHQLKFPDDKNHPEGDIADRFLNRLINDFVKDPNVNHIAVEWPLTLLLARKT